MVESKGQQCRIQNPPTSTPAVQWPLDVQEPADPHTPPPTAGSAGVVPSPKAARGIIVYIGLDETKAAADGTNLSAIAAERQAYAKELASQAETQAVIALAPEARGRDIDAVRAGANGSPAATGAPAATHGPARSSAHRPPPPRGPHRRRPRRCHHEGIRPARHPRLPCR
ncbi:hypothetical protein [Brevibacterium aurantiacum]|uniref:hypothetical protein n=1 Tax=Brevibacterium aurantiacum TaxID=273384 RepID=UPI0021532355|nr:hypothetical protein [Brevibacterium aurantiacum]